MTVSGKAGTKLLALCILLCVAASVRASTFVMPTDDEMIIRARAIVRGKVLAIESGPDDKQGFIYTFITLKVQEVLKGQITQRKIVLKEPGGQYGNRGSVVFGTPAFSTGENVVLYLDTWHDGGPADVSATHMDPPGPVRAFSDHMLLDDVNDTTIAAFLEVTGSGSQLLSAELRQLGGALAVPDRDGGALNHVTAQFIYQCVGSAIDPDSTAAGRERAALVRAALTPWDTGRTIPSFVGTHEQPQGHLDPSQIAAVDQVRQRVDPDGLFRGDITANATALR